MAQPGRYCRQQQRHDLAALNDVKAWYCHPVYLDDVCRRFPDLRVVASLADAELRAGDRPAAQATIKRGLEKDATNPALLTLARRAR